MTSEPWPTIQQTSGTPGEGVMTSESWKKHITNLSIARQSHSLDRDLIPLSSKEGTDTHNTITQ